MSQVITITFAPGRRTAIAAEPLEQWAYGQRLQFAGLDLPVSYQVDFSNYEFCGSSIPRVGGADGVSVPVEVLASGRNVYAFIWLQDATSGARAYRATVRVIPGPAPDPEESPEEQSAVTDAINALNDAAESIPEQVNAAVEAAISGGNFSGVFWATYGETTSAEVAAAVADAKLVATKRGGLVYILTNSYSLGGEVFYRFANLRDRYYGVLELTNDRWIVVSNNIPIPPVESPAFSGVPTAPTAPAGTNSDQLATTAFVQAAIEGILEPCQTISEELKQALLQLAEHVAYIDDQGETYYQDLYDALYPPKTVVLITAVFEQGSTVIYDDTALDDLKQYLTVTAKYDDNTTAILADGAYTLSGLLEAPSSTVTVAYNGLTTTFTVNVTARPVLSSITATYTQSGTVLDTDTLDSLKHDLVVTATYSDSSTQTVAAEDYTLSGTLTAGTSTITVSYGGKTTTFDVTVTSLSYVSDGLVMWLDGEKNSENGAHASNLTTWVDQSGNGWDWNNMGATVNAKSIALNGSNQYLKRAYNSFPTNVAMIEVVYKDNGTSSNGALILSGFGDANPGNILRFSGGSIGFHTGNTSSLWTKIVSTDISQIHSYSSGGYLDGIAVETASATSSWQYKYPAIGCYLGSGGNNPQYLLKGEIFCIRMYSRILSEQEILANYAVDAARFGIGG